MKPINTLINNNRKWASERVAKDPNFFSRLTNQQTPQYLWIGCADSRVPANEIIGLDPGEVFVHRNVANIVVHSDLNCLAVVQYAVEALGVQDIIVCGHYGCGGVKAAMGSGQYGLIDNWLRHLKDIYFLNRSQLDALAEEDKRLDRFCEINVAQQVANICHTTIVQDAWRKGKKLTVHGFIYSVADGLLRELGLCVNEPNQVEPLYRVG